MKFVGTKIQEILKDETLDKLLIPVALHAREQFMSVLQHEDWRISAFSLFTTYVLTPYGVLPRPWIHHCRDKNVTFLVCTFCE